jgi:hypothetical protein
MENIIPLDENVVPRPRPDNWRSNIKNTLISNYFRRFTDPDRDDPINRGYDLSDESLRNLILGENARHMYLNTYGRTNPMPENEVFEEIAQEARDGFISFRDRPRNRNQNQNENESERSGGKRKNKKSKKDYEKNQKKKTS